jgi:hypothetical protein
MGNMRPDMLYQYLLDEVGRKQPKIVKVKRGEIVDDDDAIELKAVERMNVTGRDGATGALVLVGGANGESVSKNTALLLARSRSERAAGRNQRQRRMPAGTRRDSGSDHGPATDGEASRGKDQEESGDVLPELPQVAATRMSSHETLRRNTKRLTM